MKRFEIVDFLKGYSIFATMTFHYCRHLKLSNPLEGIVSFGGTGIHLFIVLSGFGLYYSYIRKPLPYLPFLKKRISKVYAPYIFVVLLSALLSMFIPIYENSLYALGGHIFLYKMFDEHIIGSYGYPMWFISMILQFYFTFHLIVWCKSKLKNRTFLIASFFISISWALVVFLMNKESERVWNSFFLQYFWEFSLGMVLAEKVFENEGLLEKNPNQSLLLIIGVINCIFCGFLGMKAGDVGKLFNDFFALTGSACLATFLYNVKIKPLNQLFLFVGKISTAVYLLHILVILTITNLFDNLAPIHIVLLAGITVIPVSLVYQKMINRYYAIRTKQKAKKRKKRIVFNMQENKRKKPKLTLR
ncbi:acyltransferase family protein [Aureispira anguillae]|uniref:Acyltransferase n=1 Tax=Aureispira anguillae TaxID=2864201 RepID=A0A916DT29_9BACT|nr:acyltransferase [Aureispira anguillae]BDS11457.1 acyltransferase [Aureispira anguillae]